jgi:hypothetical protein
MCCLLFSFLLSFLDFYAIPWVWVYFHFPSCLLFLGWTLVLFLCIPFLESLLISSSMSGVSPSLMDFPTLPYLLPVWIQSRCSTIALNSPLLFTITAGTSFSEVLPQHSGSSYVPEQRAQAWALVAPLHGCEESVEKYSLKSETGNTYNTVFHIRSTQVMLFSFLSKTHSDSEHLLPGPILC